MSTKGASHMKGGTKNSDGQQTFEKTPGRIISAGSQEGEVFLPEERAPKPLTWQQKIARACHIENIYAREFLSEFLGTFVLVTFGLACVAQLVLNSTNIKHNIVSLQLGWAMAVALGVYVAGGGSGAHLNPAVTVAFAVMGRLKLNKVPIYLAGQYLGAFMGALVVFLTYQNALDECDGGLRQGPHVWDEFHCVVAENVTIRKGCCNTAGIFSTYPQGKFVSTWQGFVDQMFGTGMLMLMVCAITDERNMQVPKGLVPIAIGMTILALLTGFESNCGAALNPARDLGPRIFTSLAGWGSAPFSYRGGNWFWVPILGPHIGALLGAWFYNICVGLHWPYQGPRLRLQ